MSTTPSKYQSPPLALASDEPLTGTITDLRDAEPESTPVDPGWAVDPGRAAGRRPPLGRRFGYLWAASGISNLGDGVLLIGGPLLAVTVTRSPFLVSIVTAAVWLPWLLFALPAGALADRLDRRRVMMVASWSRAVGLAAVAVLVARGELNLPVLYAAALLVGVAEVFSDTSAQSILPMMVPRSRLGDANGRLIAAQTVSNHFLGAPLAGVLVGVAAASVFGAAGLCYALAGLLLLRVRGRYRVDVVSTRPMRTDIAAGLRYLWDHRLLRSLAVSSGLINLGSNAYFAVFVLWVVGEESRMGLTAAQYGLMASALGVGAVVGSLLVERVVRRLGAAQTLLTALATMCSVMAVPVLAPEPRVLFPAALLIGAASAGVNVIVVSMRQRLVPDILLGRVNASYRMIGMGGIPVGALGGGALGSIAGLPVVFGAAIALFVVAVIVVVFRVSPKALAAAERSATDARSAGTAGAGHDPARQVHRRKG
ncbi:MFS transporter [Phytoactinopolyspora limicola]|uniref:MFS transporter n=1 Tax=Phytoactinopolyspora limicola TaxID=2715536 RepID=UPI00140CB82B|nr:MFS transporter [Phytoactinopolyspora limicola]